MANEIKTDGPTIGERVVATVTEGVKQGLAGMVIGGAAGAALGAVSHPISDMVSEAYVNGSAAAGADTVLVDVGAVKDAVTDFASRINPVDVEVSAGIGAGVGAAAGGAKGAVEGLAYGNPTKWAERVAAKGTERGLENIMAKAMKEQQDFVAQIEAERKQQGSAPPTLAV